MIGFTAGTMVSTYHFYKDTIAAKELALSLALLGSIGALYASAPYVINKISKKMIH